MELEALAIKVVISAIPILLAITVHEASHGYAAKYFGDLTIFIASATNSMFYFLVKVQIARHHPHLGE